jgi:hypothetical protein
VSEEIKKEMRQLLMLVSSIRAQDNERYESHVQFSNEVVEFIKKIQLNMNENWGKIHTSLDQLNQTIEESLDSLLTGINPEGIKETSQSLKEIMDTMGRSMQSMNLENVMRELRVLSGTGVTFSAAPSGGKSKSSKKAINAGLSTAYGSVGQEAQATSSSGDDPIDGLSPEEIEAYKEAYGGQLPPHLLKKKKAKKDSHLLKPSDFFGM